MYTIFYLSHFEAGLQKIVETALVSCEYQLALHCFWIDLVVKLHKYCLLVEKIGGRVYII